MSTMDPVGIAIIGCGNIAGPYVRDFPNYSEFALRGVADVDTARAEAFAAQWNTRAYPSVDALLADPAVDLVVNLTTQQAHTAVVTRCLHAGKHVYSEKPLAMNYGEAAGLVRLAQEKGLRLACSPFTLMGEAQQTAWKWLREGRLGQVRVVYAEVNWGRIEAWHPAPEGFYAVGPLYDVGEYPLTILTGIFGPARRVTAYGTVLYPERTTKGGTSFHVERPDFVVALVELGDGVLVRLTTDFYVSNVTTRQKGIEFHGDVGSLYLESWHMFDAQVAYGAFEKPLEPVPLVRAPHKGTPWGQGLWETVTAMQAGRPHRWTGEHAAHVIEILDAITASMGTGQPVALMSTFPPPAPMEWAE